MKVKNAVAEKSGSIDGYSSLGGIQLNMWFTDDAGKLMTMRRQSLTNVVTNDIKPRVKLLDAGGGCISFYIPTYEFHCWTTGGDYNDTACGWLVAGGTLYDFCYGGGGGGGGGDWPPSGGGGTLPPPPPPPPPDPCSDAQPYANANTLLSQSSNYTIAKSNIQTASSDGNEHAVTFGKDVNNNITTSPMTSGGTSGGTVNSSWQGAFADLHNHPNDLPPSPGDLYGLISVNQNHSGYDTRIVVTPDGSVYALVVTNLVGASAFALAYPKGQIGNFPPDFPDPIFTDFDNTRIKLQIQGFSKLVAEEMTMAFVLDKYNSGMALLKQDSNGNFKRLRTEENTTYGVITYTANNCQ